MTRVNSGPARVNSCPVTCLRHNYDYSQFLLRMEN